MSQLEQIKKQRNEEVDIKRENLKNREQFNECFDTRKNDGTINTQLIKSNNDLIISGDGNVQNKFASVSSYETLYAEDSIQTSQYSSLDRAFTVQPVIKISNDENTKDRLQQYNQQTDLLHNMKANQYKKCSYQDWKE